MISIILPSRGRLNSLIKTIDELRMLSCSTLAIEVLVGADPDDFTTINYANAHADQLFVSPERWGYKELHKYYNALTKLSKGDWVLLWNDDAFMLTSKWNCIIESLPSNILVADLQTQLSPDLCCFPAVRRIAIESVRGYSPHISHADTYWQDIGRATNTIQAIPVSINHDRMDLTGGHNDITRAEAVVQYQTQQYYSDRIQALIRADIKTISELKKAE